MERSWLWENKFLNLSDVYDWIGKGVVCEETSMKEASLHYGNMKVSGVNALGMSA